ncbi:hypothetical protein AOQ84DRAFT_374099 [Glonium stellatum]|uniref:Uncharacterized protein n=1 Tax=Glonium stellatum TaxID=574774 RepID=A0A8E2F689_9PEZI|nr:hypothetical protein AOQ84DRAFT_374099 [Glonium stellatum]
MTGLQETSSFLEERENIRLLHQRNQQSLTHLGLLEKRLDNVSISDSATLEGQSSQLDTHSFSFLVQQSLKDKERDSFNEPLQNKNFGKLDECLSDDSDDTIGEGVDGDRLTKEDLIKCAKHVQKLLQRIESLQNLVSDNSKGSHHSKHRVRKVCRRFCQRIESEVLSQSNVDSSSFTPPPQYITPSGARAPNSNAEEEPVDSGFVVSKDLSESRLSQKMEQAKVSYVKVGAVNVILPFDENRFTSTKTLIGSAASGSSAEDSFSVRSLSSSDNGWNIIEHNDHRNPISGSRILESGTDSNAEQHPAHRSKDIAKETDQIPEEQPLYVNAKQFHRILKRRAARQRLQDSLQANPIEQDSDSHGPLDGIVMEYSNYALNAKDLDADRKHPVKNDALRTPENTIPNVYLDPFEVPAKHTKTNAEKLRDYQTSLMYLTCRKGKNRLKMCRTEDFERESKPPVQRNYEIAQVVSAKQNFDIVCFAEQNIEGSPLRHKEHQQAQQYAQLQTPLAQATYQTAQAQAPAFFGEPVFHHSEKRKSKQQDRFCETPEHDGEHDVKRARGDNPWSMPWTVPQDQGRVSQQYSRSDPNDQEQVHRPRSISVNPLPQIHSEEQKFSFPHETQLSRFAPLSSPQEFRPFTDGFIPPLPDFSRGASARFRPRCSKPSRQLLRKSTLGWDQKYPAGDEKEGDTDVVDMLLARWTILPATLKK